MTKASIIAILGRLATAMLAPALVLCTLSAALALPSVVEPDATDSSSKAVPAEAAPNPDHEDNVCFAPGTAVIGERGRLSISSYANKLKSDPRLHVILRGFSGNPGSRAYNLARSQERIDAVEHALEHLGVASYQIRKRSYGLPAADDADCAVADGRQSRRRVDVVLSK